MSAPPTLTADLRALVRELEADLRTRLAADRERDAQWREQHRAATASQRTATSWQEWSDDRITQAAVAWVLITVFIRFAEDNGLVKPVWISGPAQRRAEARDAQDAFLRETSRTNPDVTDREWLIEAINYLKTLPATRALVDDTSALWLIQPSGDAATTLLDFWRDRDDNGDLIRNFTDPDLDTRFLGDLYQDLSIEAQEKYALKQTPIFVEEFILDQTLEPALRERPLDGFKLIDPTCGSGHFLLGAFARLLDRWHKHAPNLGEQARVQKALDAIHGVDLNPFAVAISRFRLTIAALRASRLQRIEDAPAFKYHLAVGDSLLHGGAQQELDLGAAYSADRTAAGFAYPTENLTDLRRLLWEGQYDVVVGNPPYITVRDKALNQTYRRRYKQCKGTYALTVPFMEKFFALAKQGERAGWVGQITSNSFMKREFGKLLVEKFLPAIDLRLVIDSEGAWIPGHNTDGTPTVILVGRSRVPVGPKVRVVLSKGQREGRSYGDAGKGPYWSAIVNNIEAPGFENEWIAVTDLDRALLSKHPWSLTGGGAIELLKAISSASSIRLSSRIVLPVGRSIRAGADEAFVRPRSLTTSGKLPGNDLRPLIVGDVVRDWRADAAEFVWYPYVYGTAKAVDDGIARELWAWRCLLASRSTFQGNMADAGLQWWEYMQHTASAYQTPLSIVFAFVATHNHFVLDRGGEVFKQSAPVVKLPAAATEADHLGLLGLLNSSAACFWLKHHSQPKGGAADVTFLRTYEFTGTTLQEFPLPAALPLARGRAIDALAQRLGTLAAGAVGVGAPLTRAALDQARVGYVHTRAEMIAQQEELDWETYRLYGLLDEDLTYADDDLPALALGERAFEIVLARRLAAGDDTGAWFTRHGSTPITEVPGHWPTAYRSLVERRIALIESDKFIRLLERPEYKRRWSSEPWEKQEERALRGWLLDRLEERRFWFDGAGRPAPRSVAQLADDVARDPELVEVLALWEGRPDVPVGTSLARLLDKEGVPYLAAYRYKDKGFVKRAAWEETWRLQRLEDAKKYKGPIPVPPKYAPTDFARGEYWDHRGKLDVPKERFILYPDAGRATDPTPLLGWAGWNHAQQALALAQLIQQREAEGWEDERLVPLVAGLAELQPWLEQWHAEPDQFYGGVSPAAFFAEQLDSRCRQVGRTVAQLAAWRPEPARRGRARKGTNS